MDEETRVVPVQKMDVSFAAGDRVHCDQYTGLASRDERLPLVGVADRDAGRSDFVVEVRIPIAERKALRAIQCLEAGRKTADDRPIVIPFHVYRKFTETDLPRLDRHPVEFMIEREALRTTAVEPTTEAPPPETEAAATPVDPPTTEVEKPRKRRRGRTASKTNEDEG